MVHQRRWHKQIAPGALVALGLCGSTVGEAAGLGASPAPVFAPALKVLRTVKVPVYLPHWMPRYHQRVYISAGPESHGRAYFVNLSLSPQGGDAALVFWMTAQPEVVDDFGRRVSLTRGIVGTLDEHAGGTEGPTISWRSGATAYTIGGMAGDREVLRAARSIVRVR